ncbi:unnamed protein product [Notodromas monacha]|uniref:Uncharacterized protein n=1 Tax=Notodromas monacha TaxID=399045 RepID=A0A7R9GAJ1_9CRUS|nr:unnamed protein product [Notodromas monacha]CAG0913762.1 unnamed protein product [Notodromas monacha]
MKVKVVSFLVFGFGIGVFARPKAHRGAHETAEFVIPQGIVTNATKIAASTNNQTLISSLNTAASQNDYKGMSERLMEMATGVSGGTDQDADQAEDVLWALEWARYEAAKGGHDRPIFDPVLVMSATSVPIKVAKMRLQMRAETSPQAKAIHDNLNTEIQKYKQLVKTAMETRTFKAEQMQQSLDLLETLRASAQQLSALDPPFPYLKSGLKKVATRAKARTAQRLDKFEADAAASGNEAVREAARELAAVRAAYRSDGFSAKLMQDLKAVLDKMSTALPAGAGGGEGSSSEENKSGQHGNIGMSLGDKSRKMLKVVELMTPGIFGRNLQVRGPHPPIGGGIKAPVLDSSDPNLLSTMFKRQLVTAFLLFAFVVADLLDAAPHRNAKDKEEGKKKRDCERLPSPIDESIAANISALTASIGDAQLTEAVNAALQVKTIRPLTDLLVKIAAGAYKVASAADRKTAEEIAIGVEKNRKWHCKDKPSEVIDEEDSFNNEIRDEIKSKRSKPNYSRFIRTLFVPIRVAIEELREFVETDAATDEQKLVAKEVFDYFQTYREETDSATAANHGKRPKTSAQITRDLSTLVRLQQDSGKLVPGFESLADTVAKSRVQVRDLIESVFQRYEDCLKDVDGTRFADFVKEFESLRQVLEKEAGSAKLMTKFQVVVGKVQASIESQEEPIPEDNTKLKRLKWKTDKYLTFIDAYIPFADDLS